MHMEDADLVLMDLAAQINAIFEDPKYGLQEFAAAHSGKDNPLRRLEALHVRDKLQSPMNITGGHELCYDVALAAVPLQEFLHGIETASFGTRSPAQLGNDFTTAQRDGLLEIEVRLEAAHRYLEERYHDNLAYSNQPDVTRRAEELLDKEAHAIIDMPARDPALVDHPRAVQNGKYWARNFINQHEHKQESYPLP